MTKLINIDYLSRVEGESGVTVQFEDGKITKLRVNIPEAPRFFEAFLRGRPYADVVDFTARICGICPVAYQMSSVHAIEKIFEVEVEEPVRQLRRLLYCGEWIESHALHVYLLQGPDFYGIGSAWSSKEYLPIARQGLNFKRLGNQIMTIIGGRPIHPVSVKVGGFHKVPAKGSLLSMLYELQKAYEDSLKAIRWAAGLPFNGTVSDNEYVSLRAAGEYPMNYGDVVSNAGLDESPQGFLDCIQEYQVGHSTALHAGMKRDGSLSHYLVGPLSRLNLNHDRLPAEIIEVIGGCGIQLPLKDIQKSIIARSIELSYALYEAIRIIKKYEVPGKPAVGAKPKSGEATHITEAPRGMLIHRYALDDTGHVKSCTIVAPTSQNLAHIEKSLHAFLQNTVDKSVDFLKHETEKIVRSYDPCISCSTHLVVLK